MRNAGGARGRRGWLIAVVAGAVFVTWTSGLLAQVAQVAGTFLGQPDFQHNAPNTLSAGGLFAPAQIAEDADGSGTLYVADPGNNRVLVYFSGDTTADLVIGQPDFSSASCNQGSLLPNPATLCRPSGVAISGADINGNEHLWVADTGNHRVVGYAFKPPAKGNLAGDPPAAIVLGQASNFTSNLCNLGAPGPNEAGAGTLCSPSAVAVDATGDVFIADTGNSRVVEYTSPTTSSVGGFVFGQANFLSTSPNQGGAASAATLDAPSGVAVDATGNLYVADTGNNRTLQFLGPFAANDPSAAVVLGQTSLSTNLCNAGGAATASTECGPAGVTVNGSELVVADTSNNRVLEYSSLATGASASPILGQPSGSGNACNAGTAAQDISGVGADSLCEPIGMTFDKSTSDLLVADSGNNRILEYSTPPITIGQPNVTSRAPNSVNAQSLYLATASPSPSAGITPASVATPATAAGIVADAQGHLYVADGGNNRVFGFEDNPGFVPSTPFPAATPSPGAANLELGQPYTLTQLNSSPVSLGTASFLAADCNAGSSGLGPDSLCGPQGIAVDPDGNLFVADTRNSRVLEFNDPFAYIDYFPSPSLPTPAFPSPPDPLAPASATIVLGHPLDMAEKHKSVEPDSDAFLVSGCNLGTVSTAGLTMGTLCNPQGVAIDGRNHLFVADTGNNRVMVFDDPERLSTGDSAFQTLGSSLTPPLSGPAAVAVDSKSNLFVTDTGNNRVIEYPASTSGCADPNPPCYSDATAIVISENGTSCTSGSPVSFETLRAPNALALDGLGDLYVADAGDNRVLEYVAPVIQGQCATAVFGQAGDFSSFSPNLGANAPDAGTMWQPGGLALDAAGAGNLYVADSSNNRVLVFTTTTPTPTPTPTSTAAPTPIAWVEVSKYTKHELFVANGIGNLNGGEFQVEVGNPVGNSYRVRLDYVDIFFERVDQHGIPIMSKGVPIPPIIFLNAGFSGQPVDSEAPELIATYPVDGNVSECAKVSKKDAQEGKNIPPGCAVAVAYPNQNAGCDINGNPTFAFQFIPPIFIHPGKPGSTPGAQGNGIENSKDTKQEKADGTAIVNMKLVFTSSSNSSGFICSTNAKSSPRTTTAPVALVAAAACPNASGAVSNASCGNVTYSTQYLLDMGIGIGSTYPATPFPQITPSACTGLPDSFISCTIGKQGFCGCPLSTLTVHQ